MSKKTTRKIKPSGFSPKQMEVFKFPYEGDYDALILDGAIRSGKSIAEMLSFVLWAMSNFDQSNFIIASKTVGAAQRNIIKPLRRIKYIRQNFEIKYALTKGFMEVRRGTKVNWFYIYGGVNERSQDVVQGGTMSGAFLDEVALMPRSFVEQCIARCSEEKALLWFNCNPQHPSHWFKKEWIDCAAEKNVKYLHFTMEDNPSLSEKVKARYRRQYKGVFYQRYILGLWVAAEGIIYENFANNTEDYIIDTVPKSWSLDYIDAGVDFGGTESTTSFVLKGIYNGYKDLVILMDDELVGNYTTDDLGQKYREFEKRVHDEYGLWFNCYCDNAEPVLIRSLKNYAVSSTIMKAKKSSIFGRIKFLLTMQNTHHFWCYRRSTHAIAGLSNAVWDSKHPDTRLDNGTSNIDVCDAMEYSFERDMKKMLYMSASLH